MSEQNDSGLSKSAGDLKLCENELNELNMILLICVINLDSISFRLHNDLTAKSLIKLNFNVKSQNFCFSISVKL